MNFLFGVSRSSQIVFFHRQHQRRHRQRRNASLLPWEASCSNHYSRNQTEIMQMVMIIHGFYPVNHSCAIVFLLSILISRFLLHPHPHLHPTRRTITTTNNNNNKNQQTIPPGPSGTTATGSDVIHHYSPPKETPLKPNPTNAATT